VFSVTSLGTHPALEEPLNERFGKRLADISDSATSIVMCRKGPGHMSNT